MRKINKGQSSQNKTSDLSSCFDEDFRKELGERIRRVWEDSRMTQGEFSNILDISSVTLANYMKGARIPDALLINKIASSLNICLPWLMTGQGPMHNEEPRALPANQADPAHASHVCEESAGIIGEMKEKIGLLERELEQSRKAEREAQAEALKAYKLAIEALRPVGGK